MGNTVDRVAGHNASRTYVGRTLDLPSRSPGMGDGTSEAPSAVDGLGEMSARRARLISVRRRREGGVVAGGMARRSVTSVSSAPEGGHWCYKQAFPANIGS